MHLLAANEGLGNKNITSLLIAYLKNLTSPSTYTWREHDYGSSIRDNALKLLVASELKSNLLFSKKEIFDKISETFSESLNQSSHLNTQEKAWLVRLAVATRGEKINDKTLINIAKDAQSLTYNSIQVGDLAKYLKQREPGDTRIVNPGVKDLYLTIIFEGVPSQPQPVKANVLKIKTTYVDLATNEPIQVPEIMDDKVVEILQFDQSQEILVTHEIISGKRIYDLELSLEALLPAGFEIENPRLSVNRIELTDDEKKHEPTFIEFRDNRYLAAWSINPIYPYERIVAKYIMRAVTPGDFRLPAAQVEHMYLRQYKAQTGEARISITAK